MLLETIPLGKWGGGNPVLRTPRETYGRLWKRSSSFYRGSARGTEGYSAREGLANISVGPEPSVVYILHVTDLVVISHVGVGKNLHILYECDALTTLTYLLSLSGKLDPDDIRETHLISILAFITVVGLS
jgi:hypothetical protein